MRTSAGQPVQGGFEDFAAEIAFDPEDLAASRIVVEIDTTSITTGHGDRDATLRSSQFFATDQWPSARFESEELVRRDGDAYEARGSLTIRDLTRDVVLPFELAIREDGGGLAARAEGELTISRLEFGIGQGEWASTETVGEDVTIHIAIDATRPR